MHGRDRRPVGASIIDSALPPPPQCVRSVTAERPYSNEAALMRAIS
jgi:hypothetical protein